MKVARLTCFLALLDLVKSVKIEILLDKVLKEVRPNRITLHSDYKNGSKLINENNYHKTYKYLINRVPTATADLNNPPRLIDWNNYIIEYNRNITAPLHIIILSENSSTKLKEKFSVCLSLIQQSLFFLSNTKIIIVLNRIDFLLKGNAFALIDIAFFNFYFIDFTIVYSVNSTTHRILRHNPYSGSVFNEIYKNDSTVIIFPNKLEKINEHEMTVGVSEYYWPEIYKNYTVNYSFPYEYYYQIHLLKSYEYFKKAINMTSKFLPLPYYEDKYEQIIDNSLIIYVSLISYHMEGNMINMYPVKRLKRVLLVPVKNEKSLELTIITYYSSITIIGIIILMFICVFIFEFKVDEWSVFNIYKLMLGIGVDMDPRRSLRSIIIFFTLFVVSFFFVSDLVSDMTSLKYTNKELPLIESFEEIFEKNLTVVFPYTSILLNFLKYSNTGDIKNVTEIARLMIDNEKCSFEKVWILEEIDAQKILLRSNGILNGIKHKISHLVLQESYYAIVFPQNGILRNKFSDIYVRILEAGLDVKWRSEYDHANKISKREIEEMEDDENTLPIILRWLMIIGIIISLIVLLLEHLWFYCKFLKSRGIKISHFMRMVMNRQPTKNVRIRKIHGKPRKIQVTSV